MSLTNWKWLELALLVGVNEADAFAMLSRRDVHAAGW
jgi:hypothetical protein